MGQNVIMVGGGLVSCEVAWFLVELGRDVTITTRQEEIAYNVEVSHRGVLLEALSKANVKIYTKVSLKEITDKGVIMSSMEGEFSITGDSVVIMAGFTPNNELAEILSKKGLKTFSIGDCAKPRGIHESIYEGHIAACTV